MPLSEIISKVIRVCIPIAVATDKAKIPEFVGKFAAKTGAKILGPEEDLKVDDKRAIVEAQDYAADSTKNSHEMDALAAALFGHKQIESLIRKINSYISENSKEKIKDELYKLVLVDRLSIKSAAELIEKPLSEEAKIIRKAIHDINENNKPLSKSDLVSAYNKLNELRSDIILLRKNQNDLSSTIGRLKKEVERLKETAHEKAAEKFESNLRFSREKTERLYSQIDDIKNELSKAKEKIERTEELTILLGSKEHLLLKRLKNLSWQEFCERNKILKIAAGDILYIDDPKTFSTKTIEQIQGKVRLAVCKDMPSKKTEDTLKLILIHSAKLDSIIETEVFALVKSEEFEKEAGKTNIIHRVVDEYRKERKE